MKTIICLFAVLAVGCVTAFAQPRVPVPTKASSAQVAAGTDDSHFITAAGLASAGISGATGGYVSNQVIAAVVANFYTNNPYQLRAVTVRLGANTIGTLQVAVTNADNTRHFTGQWEQLSIGATSNTVSFNVPPGAWYKFSGNTAVISDGEQQLIYYSTNGAVTYATSSGASVTATYAPDGRELSPRQTNSPILYVSTNYSATPIKGLMSFPYSLEGASAAALAGEIIKVEDGHYTNGTLRPKAGVTFDCAAGAYIWGTNDVTSVNAPYLVPPVVRLTNNLTINGGVWGCSVAHDNFACVFGNTRDDGWATNVSINNVTMIGSYSDVYYNGMTNWNVRSSVMIKDCKLLNSAFDVVTLYQNLNSNRFVRLKNCFLSATNVNPANSENRGCFAASGVIEIQDSTLEMNNGSFGNIGLKVGAAPDGFTSYGFIRANNLVMDISGTGAYEAVTEADYESAGTADTTNIIMNGCSRLNGLAIRKNYTVTENYELTRIVEYSANYADALAIGGLLNVTNGTIFPQLAAVPTLFPKGSSGNTNIWIGNINGYPRILKTNATGAGLYYRYRFSDETWVAFP